jgi:GNAT superfamily N-acetyltransferase
MSYAIRPLQDADLDHVAALGAALEQGVAPERLARRFRWLKKRAAHENAFFVATDPDCRIVGFIHVHGITLLGSIAYAEIGSLVVAPALRRRGIGRLLVRAGESWARARSFATMRLRHGRERPSETHGFYRQLGFEPAPTRALFHKTIDAA